MTAPGAQGEDRGESRVLVAVDGSEAGAEAAALAAREARLRGGALHVVHVLAWPLMATARMPLPPPDSALHQQAEQIVTDAVHRATEAEPDVEVTWQIVIGQPLRELDVLAQEADLLVLGSSGRGAFAAAVGSVAVHMSASAPCPVLVHRGREAPEGPVLLAVDGSEDSDAAAAFAFAEAGLRGAPLVALHVSPPRPGPAPAGMSAMDALLFEDYPRDTGRDDADRARDQEVAELAIAAHRKTHPDVRASVRTERAHVRPALIDASADAQLLVLGARGRGGFTGLLLGSVSQALLQHAQCPLTVVRRDTAMTARTAA
ncbi:universal stress protein [Streptomyces sp. NPDC048172]|uniref:universal stress protein n=1 Tax=Streptomyces sp. NPDC048172 TaxID=3365505 RepID=UPI0037124CC9